MNILQSLVLGVVEGFTEFLPISSTAHLIITSRFLGVIQSDYTKTFEIAIQSGAILAVLVLYFRRFLDVEVLKRIIVAFIPTGVLGLLFYSFIKDSLFGSMSVVLWALGLGGFVLILFEYLFKSSLPSLSFLKRYSKRIRTNPPIPSAQRTTLILPKRLSLIKL